MVDRSGLRIGGIGSVAGRVREYISSVTTAEVMKL